MNNNNKVARRPLSWLSILFAFHFLAGSTAVWFSAPVAAEPLLVGMTYPNTGRYRQTGIDQARGALQAIDEINADGGIGGRMLALQIGSKGRQGSEKQQVQELVDAGVVMAFGGSLMPEVTAQAAADQHLLYFDTHFHSPSERLRDPLVFYESADSWMASKALAFYINQQLTGRKVFYVSSNNQWGQMSEGILRRFISDTGTHADNSSVTQFPSPRIQEFKKAFEQALEQQAEVLVLVQVGEDLSKALQVARDMGLHQKMTLVAPMISQAVAYEVGPEGMDGVIATVPWSWQVARDYRFQSGEDFTANYLQRYKTHPSASAASAWSVVWQFARAARELNSLDVSRIAEYLRGRQYTALKDPQRWREFDQLSVQSMYVVEGRSRGEVIASEHREDFFRVVSDVPGQVLVLTREEWQARAWQYQLAHE